MLRATGSQLAVSCLPLLKNGPYAGFFFFFGFGTTNVFVTVSVSAGMEAFVTRPPGVE